jgi:hypothetical protein
MRLILIALILSACSTYPAIDWPDTAGAGVTPALLSQAELAGPVAGADPGPALAGRAAALRASFTTSKP